MAPPSVIPVILIPFSSHLLELLQLKMELLQLKMELLQLNRREDRLAFAGTALEQVVPR